LIKPEFLLTLALQDHYLDFLTLIIFSCFELLIFHLFICFIWTTGSTGNINSYPNCGYYSQVEILSKILHFCYIWHYSKSSVTLSYSISKCLMFAFYCFLSLTVEVSKDNFFVFIFVCLLKFPEKVAFSKVKPWSITKGKTCSDWGQGLTLWANSNYLSSSS
jgi:hypothetical protein